MPLFIAFLPFVDLYILPSSVHELILVPAYEYIDVYQLYEMVKEVNDTQVAPEERLTDRAYILKV